MKYQKETLFSLTFLNYTIFCQDRPFSELEKSYARNNLTPFPEKVIFQIQIKKIGPTLGVHLGNTMWKKGKIEVLVGGTSPPAFTPNIGKIEPSALQKVV